MHSQITHLYSLALLMTTCAQTGSRAVLWRLHLAGPQLTWAMDIIIGNPVAYAGPEQYKGAYTTTYGEASAAYDSVKKKAYVFGGWHDDYCW